jgi:hypothetical protein
MSSQMATLASAVFPTLHAAGVADRVGSKKNQGCTLDAALIACDSSAAGQGSPAFSEPPAPCSHRSWVQSHSFVARTEHDGCDVGCKRGARLELVSSTQTTRAEPSLLRRPPSPTGRLAPLYRAFSATGMSAPAPSFRGRYSSRRHAPRATAAITAASTIMLFTFMVFSPSSAIASIGYRGGPLRSRTQLLFQRFSTPVDAKMPLELCTSARLKRATPDSAMTHRCNWAALPPRTHHAS